MSSLTLAVPEKLLMPPSNKKLGDTMYSFSIPAKTTCPGRSPACTAACYAAVGFMAYPSVVEAYEARYEATKQPDFVDRMVREIAKSRVIDIVRVHVSGDFYDAEYAEKWRQIALQCRKTMFYAYTRSWRDPEILPVLKALAALKNVRLWFSADRDTGPAPKVRGAQRAFMADQVGSEDLVSRKDVDLVFRTRGHRARVGKAKRFGGVLVCPHEQAPVGKILSKVSCGKCRICFTPTRHPALNKKPEQTGKTHGKAEDSR